MCIGWRVEPLAPPAPAWRPAACSDDVDDDADDGDEELLLLALRRTFAACRVTGVMAAGLATDIETADVLGESGDSKCSGVKLPSESPSLDEQEGGVNGKPY